MQNASQFVFFKPLTFFFFFLNLESTGVLPRLYITQLAGLAVNKQQIPTVKRQKHNRFGQTQHLSVQVKLLCCLSHSPNSDVVSQIFSFLIFPFTFYITRIR